MTDTLSDIGFDMPTGEDVDIPVDSATDFPSATSSDLTCIVCDTPLSYAGRGAKPKYCSDHKKQAASKTSTGKSSGQVEAAMQVLSLVNDLLGLPIGVASPAANQLWKAQKPSLEARVRPVLQADPALAKRIAGMGAVGGKWALMGAYAMALGPVTAVAAADMRAKREERERQMNEAAI